MGGVEAHGIEVGLVGFVIDTGRETICITITTIDIGRDYKSTDIMGCLN
jgi:hypothetical protein